jgi:hypothetical protein
MLELGRVVARIRGEAGEGGQGSESAGQRGPYGHAGAGRPERSVNEEHGQYAEENPQHPIAADRWLARGERGGQSPFRPRRLT